MHRFTRRLLGLAFIGATLSCFITPESAEAGGYYRQRYSSWSYKPSSSYYYSRYTYHPVVSTVTTRYHYHYAVHYPSRPRYVYYYNPVRRVYWGRYDIQEGGYSMLKQEDRKEKLEEIPESAFPKPAEMPPIPESSDGEKMAKPDLTALPKHDAAPDTP
ncbi:MAG: hypothetical protein ACF8CQ_03715 [Rhodopirellula sp. JB044]|uniref:hypothetical protein n=1 Tax=Rhodopirellula sp. JB044 TaxID=3342844 RepID=UPI00370C3F2F